MKSSKKQKQLYRDLIILLNVSGNEVTIFSKNYLNKTGKKLKN